jgi:hypothetical protein
LGRQFVRLAQYALNWLALFPLNRQARWQVPPNRLTGGRRIKGPQLPAIRLLGWQIRPSWNKKDWQNGLPATLSPPG